MRIKISILLFIPFQFISLSVCYAQSDILNNCSNISLEDLETLRILSNKKLYE